MDKHLFLVGGGPPFTNKMAKLFLEKSSKSSGPIAILFIERDGWEVYIEKYTHLLQNLGMNQFTLLPLISTPIDKIVKSIKLSSGIMIGSGDTNLYADYIVKTPISAAIKKRYESGVPVAGFSAGALISPELCIISSRDNTQKEFQSRQGIGLLSKVLIAVHFTEWNDEKHLRYAACQFRNNNYYGIDEKTCVYFLNGQLKATEGKGVYQLKNGLLITIN